MKVNEDKIMNQLQPSSAGYQELLQEIATSYLSSFYKCRKLSEDTQLLLHNVDCILLNLP